MGGISFDPNICDGTPTALQYSWRLYYENHSNTFKNLWWEELWCGLPVLFLFLTYGEFEYKINSTWVLESSLRGNVSILDSPVVTPTPSENKYYGAFCHERCRVYIKLWEKNMWAGCSVWCLQLINNLEPGILSSPNCKFIKSPIEQDDQANTRSKRHAEQSEWHQRY